MISNIKISNMGTVCFSGKFGRMTKPPEFICYPLGADADPTKVMVQSDTRIGHIWLKSGIVTMSPPKPGGAYGIHIHQAKQVAKLTGEELLMRKSQIIASASGKAGTNGMVVCDNSGAVSI